MIITLFLLLIIYYLSYKLNLHIKIIQFEKRLEKIRFNYEKNKDFTNWLKITYEKKI